MIRQTILTVSVLACLVATAALSRPQSPPRDTSHDAWVIATLKQMTTVKVGMTEADLLAVFKRENPNGSRTGAAGIATAYVSRTCPYFKVDVVFSDKSPFDTIVQISRPYIELPMMFD